ncbi:hypothetical protein K5X82_12895 [Halosquirtibacter xylanolyticus]|uniref:hypothetical protein n=1 Tax=Halosquirtibacter xylanolyticus TaxID=3374599 RepID=UPI0037480A6C|nr:hypothetical protein K5X82_12895 [Prolixibacteraceae bacterium]
MKKLLILFIIFASCKKEDLPNEKEDLPMEMRGVYKLIEAKADPMDCFDINNDGIESNDILGQIINSDGGDENIKTNLNNARLFTFVMPKNIYITFPRTDIYFSASENTFSRYVKWRYNAQRYVLDKSIYSRMDNINYVDGSWSHFKYENEIMTAKYESNFYNFKEKNFRSIIVYVKFKKIGIERDDKTYKIANETSLVYSKDYPKR